MRAIKVLCAFGLGAALAGCGDDDVPAPVCGNGAVELGEQCDDGNGASGDGCSSACRVELPGPECGNEVLETGEECDDGNTAPGDGCDAMCRIEVPAPVCGNGDVETGEDCDDGNTMAGDGCSATCQDEPPVPVCGNGDLELGEQCDDGNTMSGDGCSATCQNEVTPGCGDGVREGTEECDDGNTMSGDGCSATCTIEMTGPYCGNGVVEGTEQCDDGNTMGGDGCSATCTLEAGGCGNGVLNAGEECDDGNTTPGDGCDATCHLEGPACGNGTVEAGEQCDDGNLTPGDGCSATCRFEVCGDGVVQPSEQCDDGNTTNGDGCSQFCQLEVAAGCGNGVREAAEECDDGNTISGDGCSATCTVEPTGTCAPDWELVCAASDSWSTLYSGATDTIDSYACVAWDESGPEYTYSFVASTTSNVTVALSGMSADLDVFVLSSTDGACAATSCIAFGDVSATFTTTPGATYFVVVDGYLGASGPYSLEMTCGGCGDGNVDPGEQCDDGNLTAGDGCSASCALEGCGNGTVDPGEGCDDSNLMACDGCSATCQTEGCGNFVVECAEQCDDGNTASGDGCSETCADETGTCTVDYSLSCGGSDAYGTTFSGSTDGVDFYSCVPWNESGREYTYTFVAEWSGAVTVTLSGLAAGVDLDVFVLGAGGGVCDSANCIAYGNSSATFTAVAGATYYFVVDGYNGAEGSYTLEVSCAGGACGDGAVQAGEQCDDGNTFSEDGCSAMCLLELCGDGTLQPGLGEECDDGNNVAMDGCSATCQDEAGNCTPDFTLGCAASDGWNNGAAGSTDRIDSYLCQPTWNETGPEYTYSFTAVVDGDVTAALSGLSVDLDVFVLEDAGDGACNPDTCVAGHDSSVTWAAVAGRRYYVVVDGYLGAVGDFTLEMTCGGGATCGNGTLELGEECDDGNTASGDGCSAVCHGEAGTCVGDYAVTCGSTDSYSTLGSGATDAIDEYGCGPWSEEGPEYTYTFTTTAETDVTVTLSPEAGVDLDVFVLVEPGTGCAAGNCLGAGDSSAGFHALPGTTYYVVVDGYLGAEGSYSIQFACP